MNRLVMNRIHMLCAWSGLAFALSTLVGIIVLARFFPPPSPALPTDAVVALYQGNLTGIRAGMVCMMMGAGLFIPFTSLITHYLIRVEGRVGVISIMQIMGGYANMMLFFYPCLWWLTASFRMDRDPQLIQMLHDAAWLQYLGALAPFLFMLASVAIAAFVDDHERPVFPRWYGWFNLMAIMAFLPDQLVFFFKTGPFAWNGVFGWWIPLFDFFGWILVTFWLLRRAVLADRAT
jgi:hypothetical protein